MTLELPSCLGVHLRSPRPDAVPIAWSEPTRRNQRVRVIRHTCDQCTTEAYELCAGGGLLFIRRTIRWPSGGIRTIAETDRLPLPGGRQLWQDLVTGCAR